MRDVLVYLTAVAVNPLRAHWNRRATDHQTTIRWSVHQLLMGGLLHLVQQGGARAGSGHAVQRYAMLSIKNQVPSSISHPWLSFSDGSS